VKEKKQLWLDFSFCGEIKKPILLPRCHIHILLKFPHRDIPVAGWLWLEIQTFGAVATASCTRSTYPTISMVDLVVLPSYVAAKIRQSGWSYCFAKLSPEYYPVLNVASNFLKKYSPLLSSSCFLLRSAATRSPSARRTSLDYWPALHSCFPWIFGAMASAIECHFSVRRCLLITIP